MYNHPSPAAVIAAALGARAEDVCRRYLPQGRRQGRYWVAGDLDGARGRSLFVRLHGPGTPGKWTDAAVGRCDRHQRRRHHRRHCQQQHGFAGAPVLRPEAHHRHRDHPGQQPESPPPDRSPVFHIAPDPNPAPFQVRSDVQPAGVRGQRGAGERRARRGRRDSNQHPEEP